MAPDSAESVTKLLRGKGTKPRDAAETALALLAGSLPVHLPNGPHFVLELLVDRFLNTAQFGAWKHEPALWRLFGECWAALDTDTGRPLRARLLSRMKLVSVLEALFRGLSLLPGHERKRQKTEKPPSGPEALAPALHTVQTVLSSAYIDVDEYHSMGLLGAYFTLLQQHLLADLKAWEAWSLSVHQIIGFRRNPLKNSAARYFAEVFAPHTVLMAAELPPNTHKLVAGLWLNAFADPQSAPAHVAQAAAVWDDASAQFFFSETLAHWAASDLPACEAVYTLLATEKPHMAAPLLDVLAKVNRTLLPAFFAAVYAAASANKDTRLVGRTLRLNGALALQHWQQALAGHQNSPEYVELVVDVAHGFALARETPAFVRTAFPELSASVNGSDLQRLCRKLAPVVADLLGNQLAKLGSEFASGTSTNSEKPLTLLLLALLLCLPQKQAQAAAPFARKLPSTVAFLALCVYPETAHFYGDVKPKSAAPEILYRLAELLAQPSSGLTKQITKAAPSALVPLAQRWLVLMAHVDGAWDVWMKAAFDKVPVAELVAFFTAHQLVLCELRPFLRALATAMALKMVPEAVGWLPPAVFRDFFAHSADLLLLAALKDKTHVPACTALAKVLVGTPLASATEQDPQWLVQLAEKTDQSHSAPALELLGLLWAAHVAARNFGYVDKVLRHLETLRFSPQLLAKTVFARPAPLKHYDVVLGQYIAQVAAQVTVSTYANSLDALEGVHCTAAARPALTEAITKLGLLAVAGSEARLFSLVAALAPESRAVYVASLGVAVLQRLGPDPAVPKVLHSLAAYFGSVLKDTVSQIVDRSLPCPPEYAGPVCDVLAVLAAKMSPAQIIKFLLLAGEPTVVGADSGVRVLQAITPLLRTNQQFSQYAVESVLALADAVLKAPIAKPTTPQNQPPATPLSRYQAAADAVSAVLLFHRFRLSNRYSLVLRVISGFFRPLCQGPLQGSPEAAKICSRLVFALCEVQALGQSSLLLSSRAALYRKALRKHVHVLLVSYVHLHLTVGFASDVVETLMPALYAVFGLLTKAELTLASACLDAPGKTYFQTFYGTYRNHGRWASAL